MNLYNLASPEKKNLQAQIYPQGLFRIPLIGCNLSEPPLSSGFILSNKEGMPRKAVSRFPLSGDGSVPVSDLPPIAWEVQRHVTVRDVVIGHLHVNH